MKDRDTIKGEIRYAIRLCQRTARLYRRIQTAGVFLSIAGGSAVVASAATSIPAALTYAGSITLALAGAALIAIRPADKAASNESDVRRYQALMAKLPKMHDNDLEAALEEAHQGDTQEVEPLRNVAYNDVVAEIGRKDCLLPLSLQERAIKLIA